MKKIIYDDLVVLREDDYGSLILRPIRDEDTYNIVRWRNNETIRSQFIFREPFTPKMHRAWLEGKVYSGDVIQYIIEYYNRPIGSIYIRDIDLINESGEFGIFIGETAEIGKGIGGKAIKKFIKYCFDLGFHRIFLRVLEDNVIAKECYKKAGFEIEGLARDMVCINGIRYNIVFMSIVR